MGDQLLLLPKNPSSDAGPEQPMSDSGNPIQDVPQSLQDLVSNMELNIELRGTLLSHHATTNDFFCPRMRRPPLGSGLQQHLDVVSCWKGLSNSMASELHLWNCLFREALAIEVKERLQRDFVLHLTENDDGTNSSLLTSRAMEYFGKKYHRLAYINTQNVVHNILSAFYSIHYTEDSSRASHWSLGSGDIPSFVYNFVRIQDCFLHIPDGPFVTFTTLPFQTEGMLSIIVNLEWHSPQVTIQNREATLAGADIFRISPNLDRVSLGASCCNRFERYDDGVTYAVLRSPLSLQWNPASSSFEGQMPALPSDISYVKTLLCATISTRFPCGVLFERKSRYLLKSAASVTKALACDDTLNDTLCEMIDLNGTPSFRVEAQEVISRAPLGAASIQPAFSSRGCGQASRSVVDNTLSPDSLVHCHQARQRTAGDGTEAEDISMILPPVDCYYPPFNSIKQSHLPLSKRKASNGVRPPASSDSISDQLKGHNSEDETKRQRIMHSNHEIIHSDADPEWLDPRIINITTGLPGEAHSSSAADLHHRSDWRNNGKSETLTKQFVARRGGVKQTIFPWQSGDKHQDSVVSSPSPTCSSEDDSRPRTTENATTCAGTNLLQEIIRRNYLEFEQRSSQKAVGRQYYAATVQDFDGNVSPTDEDAKAFERIFLDDSTAEDWEDDADTLNGSVDDGAV